LIESGSHFVQQRRSKDDPNNQAAPAPLKDQVRTERLLHLLTENLPIIVWMTNADRSDFFYSPRWGEFTGLTGRKISGELWLGLLHPEDRKAVVESFEAAFTRRRSWSMEYRLQHKDGTYHWMLDMGEPCHDEDGLFAGFVGNSIDVTDRHTAMEEIQRVNSLLEARNRSATLISQMNDDLQVCKTLDETSPLISLYMQRLFPDNPGAVFLINESRSLVESLVEWGGSDIEPVFTREECWALRKGKLHMVEGPGTGVLCKHVAAGTDASMCVPMIAQGDVLGMTHLRAARPQDGVTRPLESSRELITALSDDLALNLSSIRSREALRHQSVRDPLTRLYNRRYMVESLERELARARRRNLHLAVVMADVDHFKQYNDSYGHHAGDAVLAGIGKFLLTNLRTEDIACRYGGEELTLIMPDVDPAALVHRLDGIREKIAALQFEHMSQQLGTVTMSLPDPW
jgi:diguanylate cyclase (GGDEF)-like protein/PAS domain S-box-containing protein